MSEERPEMRGRRAGRTNAAAGAGRPAAARPASSAPVRAGAPTPAEPDSFDQAEAFFRTQGGQGVAPTPETPAGFAADETSAPEQEVEQAHFTPAAPAEEEVEASAAGGDEWGEDKAPQIPGLNRGGGLGGALRRGLLRGRRRGGEEAESDDEGGLVLEDGAELLGPESDDDLMAPGPDGNLGTAGFKDLKPFDAQTGVMSYLKPGGHWNKRLIYGGAGLILFAVLLFGGNGKLETDPQAKKSDAGAQQKEAPSVGRAAEGDLSGVVAGDASALQPANAMPMTGDGFKTGAGGMTQPGQTPILAAPGSDVQSVQMVAAAGGGAQPGPIGGGATQPVAAAQPAAQAPAAAAPAPRPAAPERPRPPDDFALTLRAGGRQADRAALDAANRALPQQQEQSRQEEASQEEPRLTLPRGTRISMTLVDPIRSGVETIVQARSLTSVRDRAGKEIIPVNTQFEIKFAPYEVNGRVVAAGPIAALLPDGRVVQMSGVIKGDDGFAGLTGRIIKAPGSGGPGIGGRILGGLGRVGGGLLGGLPGGAGSEAQGAVNDVTGAQGNGQIAYSKRIVEVPAGTRFLIVLGAQE